MRLFVGIPLADPVSRELEALCARLRAEGDHLRWSAPEAWHITLQFLGNAGAGQLDCLTLRLAQVSSPPVPVQLGNLGVFDRAGVFLVEIEPTTALEQLQRRVTAATAPCGFDAEERPYRPHITLARAKGDGRRQLRRLKERAGKSTASDPTAAVRFTPFAATEFLLYESNLGPGGSKYEVKARFALNGPV